MLPERVRPRLVFTVTGRFRGVWARSGRDAFYLMEVNLGLRLVECVPNFSEGRKAEVVARLVEAVESVEGALVLGTHLDPDHNRSVITFVAPPDRVVEAAVRVVARAAGLIDLSRHTG